jgi:hypothetical protein
MCFAGACGNWSGTWDLSRNNAVDLISVGGPLGGPMRAFERRGPPHPGPLPKEREKQSPDPGAGHPLQRRTQPERVMEQCR